MQSRDSGKCCPYCYEPLMERKVLITCPTGSMFRWIPMSHTCDVYKLAELEDIKSKEKLMTQVEKENKAEQDGRDCGIETDENAKPDAYCPYAKGSGTLYVKWLQGWYAEKSNQRIGHILTKANVGRM